MPNHITPADLERLRRHYLRSQRAFDTTANEYLAACQAVEAANAHFARIAEALEDAYDGVLDAGAELGRVGDNQRHVIIQERDLFRQIGQDRDHAEIETALRRVAVAQGFATDTDDEAC